MKIENVPFMTTNWDQVPSTTYPGETGTALWRTIEVGNIRVRIVEYSAGYLADHWCTRGHVVYVLEGEFVSELKDGRSFNLSAGMSYQVATDAEPHRSISKSGAKLLIVD
jgi:quercetin dioxygenase-like cupin family protein